MVDFIKPSIDFVLVGTRVQAFLADRGQGLPSHIHSRSHALFVVSGSIVIRILDERCNLTTHYRDAWDQPVELPEDRWHEIEASEDNTIFMTVHDESQEMRNA